MLQRNLPNLLIKKKATHYSYTPATGGGGAPNFPHRANRKEHGQRLEKQFEVAWQEIEDKARSVVSVSSKHGVYLEIKGKAGYDLLTKSLEDIRQKVRLYNVREDSDGVTCATVFVPNNKKDFFLKKINKFKETEDKNKVIATIEQINSAFIEALWIGAKERIPKTAPSWCEAWLMFEHKENYMEIVAEFFNLCEIEGVSHKTYAIPFPERVVVGIKANEAQLTALQLASGRIAEIRLMATPTGFFDALDPHEQREWMKELLDRVTIENNKETAVCVLDTGVNNGHPLLELILDDSDMHTVLPQKGVHDNHGHGTKMAGISSYFNLEEKLETMDPIHIYHFLESVKLVEDGRENRPELYGYLTAQAVALAEIKNPQISRAVCMAITEKNGGIIGDGRPSSWSGAIDALAAGADLVDQTSSASERRLFFISTGNTCVVDITEANDFEVAVQNHSVESPGQAWNAITVGAFTEKAWIDDPEYSNYRPVATPGGYSPFTASSLHWGKKWPIKPDIVLEGGNLGYDEENSFYSEVNDLNLLTTSKDFLLDRPFETFNMTSAATAQAAWLGANIQYHFPELWPETIRALLIHSAEWTSTMKEQILPSKGVRRNDYRQLLRLCGYGVPSLERALWSSQNSVNMIIENELQPFIKRRNSIVSNEMHLHELPWPKEILLDLGNVPVRMRVTLSYFIQPGPGEIGWKDKYQYPSCGLRFDVNNSLEGQESFLKRINVTMRDDVKEDKGDVKNDSTRWVIGIDNRDVGSIHSDIWEGTASDLSESDLIAVYPVMGWWKTRSYLKQYHSKVRYSLVITLETPKTNVDLYSAIKSKITIPVIIPVR